MRWVVTLAEMPAGLIRSTTIALVVTAATLVTIVLGVIALLTGERVVRWLVTLAEIAA